MASLECTLTTPESAIFEGSVRSVVVPAADGELGILPRHAPLVGSLGVGELRVESESGEKSRYFVDGGFLQVSGQNVTVLAARATNASELDRTAEHARLEELTKERPAPGSDPEEFDAHERAMNAQKVRVKMSS
ncbi:MAG: ATP synthase F1 subunit epsilon [Planctomycetota bacterium]